MKNFITSKTSLRFGKLWSCFFLCVSDGSKSVEYSEQTMEEALKKVEKMEADLGGTEILMPLKHIYSQPCIPSQPRQVTHTAMHSIFGAMLVSCRSRLLLFGCGVTKVI